ncbi:hypothetical protein ACTOB_007532 [Actinoplanes oblitus]|uniref:Uncharacterized protein n=1 Tax=Actinoplanes oblitus TaxID=3040509 RepID=A0ABY8WG02_9ACTN|nr:hypothetical protein [Actinoplanes oblitus]WIM95428.1 hypothetical protein ACTOB_007532 [Actinoplanes oblitus]
MSADPLFAFTAEADERRLRTAARRFLRGRLRFIRILEVILAPLGLLIVPPP